MLSEIFNGKVEDRFVETVETDLRTNNFKGLRYSNGNNASHEGRNEGRLSTVVISHDRIFQEHESIVVEESIDSFSNQRRPQSSEAVFHRIVKNGAKFFHCISRTDSFYFRFQ